MTGSRGRGGRGLPVIPAQRRDAPVLGVGGIRRPAGVWGRLGDSPQPEARRRGSRSTAPCPFCACRCLRSRFSGSGLPRARRRPGFDSSSGEEGFPPGGPRSPAAPPGRSAPSGAAGLARPARSSEARACGAAFPEELTRRAALRPPLQIARKPGCRRRPAPVPAFRSNVVGSGSCPGKLGNSLKVCK